MRTCFAPRLLDGAKDLTTPSIGTKTESHYIKDLPRGIKISVERSNGVLSDAEDLREKCRPSCRRLFCLEAQRGRGYADDDIEFTYSTASPQDEHDLGH